MALARLKGKIPKEIPFELKRCESCRRAKQGAIVCRVVRAHDGITEPDGGDWAPPAGFREWLAAWKAGDGKSTIRTPTKKPKRPRPPPKPKEEEPERRAVEFWPQATVGPEAAVALLKNPATADPCSAALHPSGRAAEVTSVMLMGEPGDGVS